MKLLLIILLNCIPITTGKMVVMGPQFKLYHPDIVQADVLYAKSDYDSLKHMLKIWEGFRGELFIGIAGERLIGYGHLVKKKDIRKFIRGLTERAADSLLMVDMNKIIEYTHRRTSLKGKQLLAVSSLVFNTGTVRFSHSDLLKFILNNDTIYNSEWLTWCNYRHKGKWISSKHLLSRRKWEVKFYTCNK